jgi:HSP20 family protein
MLRASFGWALVALKKDYWDPFNFGTRSLRQIVGTMDKLLDASSLVNLPQDAVARPYGRLPWDIIEAEDCYHMRIDLPGFNRDEVKVRVEENNNVFSVDAEHREDNKDKWRTRSHGRCRTRIALPDGVDASGISARLDNGVLDVSIPKLKKEKKVLDVKVE